MNSVAQALIEPFKNMKTFEEVINHEGLGQDYNLNQNEDIDSSFDSNNKI